MKQFKFQNPYHHGYGMQKFLEVTLALAPPATSKN
jgi:hypothetical protein